MKNLFLAVLCCASLYVYPQRFTEIIVEPDTAGKSIGYGSKVSFRFYTVSKKNKEKEVNYRKVNDYIACSATGASWNENTGTVSITARPAEKGFVRATLLFLSKDPDVQLNQTIEIRLNFKEPLKIDYSGTPGSNGSRGDNKGTPLLQRDGKMGDNGGDGGNGGPGSRITTRFKREYDELLQRELLFVYVTDDSLHTESVFRCMKPEAGIVIDVNGGKGGDGGRGGDGGNGKDGVKNEKEDKRPGDAGSGGKGGNGGHGGKGGQVTVIVHTNCSDIFGYLKIENFGGQAGNAGRGGDKGKPGTAATGQTAAQNGTAGTDGLPGLPGAMGKPFVLRVEDF